MIFGEVYSTCISQCHDDKLERYLSKWKLYIAKQEQYISRSGNDISQSQNDIPQSGNDILLAGNDISQSDKDIMTPTGHVAQSPHPNLNGKIKRLSLIKILSIHCYHRNIMSTV